MRKIFMVLVMASLTSVASAAEHAIPLPLAGAKAGEWVTLMEVAGENVGQKAKITVAEVNGSGADAMVVLRRERFDLAGELVETNDLEVPLERYISRMTALEDKAAVTKETLIVKDAEIEVSAIAWKDEENAREIKLWISDDIPVGGVVKSWSSDPDFPAVELVDFGS